jgi:vitamin B12 transporter
VVVTGSRLAGPLLESATSVPRAELERASDLPSALRPLATLHVDQPGTPAGFGSLYLRGADPNHTVLLLDGVKLNDISNTRGGGFDLGALDPRLLERVDVLPGATSALYGADAMAGALTLQSLAPGGRGVSANAGAGGLGYRRLGAAYDASAWRASAAEMEDGGTHDLGFKRIRSGGLRLANASLMAWEHESRAFPEDSGGPRYAVRRELEERDTQTLLAGAHAGSRAMRLQFGLLSQDADVTSPGVAPGLRDPVGIPRSTSSTRFNRGTATLSAELGRALVGAEYQREEGDAQSAFLFGPVRVPSDFRLERNTRSLFAEARGELAPRWQSHAGVRVDSIDRFGTRLNARAALRYAFSSGDTLTGSAGTGFKPPSFFALGNPLVGNPALRPEESTSAELAFATRESASFRQRVSVFRSQYRNLVDFDAGPPPRLVNRDRVGIDGVEYAARTRVNNVELGGSLSALRFRLPEGEGPLRNRPRNKASLYAAGPPSALSWRIAATRVGQTFDSSIPTGGRYLAPYTVVDAALTHARERRRAQLALDNVFNRDYEQFIGFPSPGRRLRLDIGVALP